MHTGQSTPSRLPALFFVGPDDVVVASVLVLLVNLWGVVVGRVGKVEVRNKAVFGVDDVVGVVALSVDPVVGVRVVWLVVGCSGPRAQLLQPFGS